MQHILFTSRETTGSQLRYHLDRCVFPLSKYDERTTNFRSDRNAVVYFIERATREIQYIPKHWEDRYERIIEQLHDGSQGIDKVDDQAWVIKLADMYWDQMEEESLEESWQPEDTNDWI